MTASEPARDRRDDGRPEQARPRDRTGRPLPHGTTGIPLTEEHEPATVEEALELGAALWDEQRFFEAHECLEAVWHAAPEEDRDLWQGVIQVAVAAVHVQRDNPHGAVTLLERAASRLDAYPDLHRGIEVGPLRREARARAARIAEHGLDGVTHPAFPAAPGGAWFTPDPAALEPPTTPTPVPDGPAWLTALERRPDARARRPQRRTAQTDQTDQNDPGAPPTGREPRGD
ncbi:MAG: DUF309 domain-containing protein [Nitriliruptoraceae bacterium]|nr:DUF309 domain-containing protein [Nitriliruptoraceae bacterium]